MLKKRNTLLYSNRYKNKNNISQVHNYVPDFIVVDLYWLRDYETLRNKQLFNYIRVHDLIRFITEIPVEMDNREHIWDNVSELIPDTLLSEYVFIDLDLESIIDTLEENVYEEIRRRVPNIYLNYIFFNWLDETSLVLRKIEDV